MLKKISAEAPLPQVFQDDGETENNSVAMVTGKTQWGDKGVGAVNYWVPLHSVG